MPEKLTEMEQKILKMRYCDGMTLVEIGQHFGVARERIRQIEAKAMRKMKGEKMTLADAIGEVNK